MPRPPEVLAVGDVRLVIDLDHGARAIEWAVGELSLLARHGDDPVEYGMYPMAPWAGRLRGNRATMNGEEHVLPTTYGPWALHGTVLDQPVEVIELVRTDERVLLVGQVVEHAGWPWPMAVDIIWDLRERELITEINVYPRDGQFPVVVGWHPWFRRDLGRGGPLEWSIDATAQAERGEDHLPTGRLIEVGEGPFDDAFVVPDGRATVRWPGALTLDIQNDHEWYVVFDELPGSACVEPQSGPPNAFNDDLGRPVPSAAPGRPHLMVTRWTMRDAPLADQA